jgi:hypothetical protein
MIAYALDVRRYIRCLHFHSIAGAIVLSSNNAHPFSYKLVKFLTKCSSVRHALSRSSTHLQHIFLSSVPSDNFSQERNCL